MATPTIPKKRECEDGEDDLGLSTVSPRKTQKYDFWGSIRRKPAQGLRIIALKEGPNPNGSLEFRVISKGRMNITTNGRSFTFYGMDESGKIKFFCFSKDAEKYFEMIKLNEVFRLKGFHVTASDPKYVNISENPLQINFIATSVLEAADTEIPEIKFNFVLLNQINEKVNKYVDVVVIIAFVPDAKSVNINGKSVRRQEVQVTDQTEEVVSIYFWGNNANELSLKQFDVIEFRNLRVTKYNEEISMKFKEGSVLIPDSQLASAAELRAYLEEERNKANN